MPVRSAASFEEPHLARTQLSAPHIGVPPVRLRRYSYGSLAPTRKSSNPAPVRHRPAQALLQRSFPLPATGRPPLASWRHEVLQSVYPWLTPFLGYPLFSHRVHCRSHSKHRDCAERCQIRFSGPYEIIIFRFLSSKLRLPVVLSCNPR